MPLEKHGAASRQPVLVDEDAMAALHIQVLRDRGMSPKHRHCVSGAVNPYLSKLDV